jgi:DNA repair exonuclease SbcCD ATPase subunit
VLLRRSDRDESSVQLSIRLLAEVAPSTQLIKVRSIINASDGVFLVVANVYFSHLPTHAKVQLVRLYISNETDPSFLHTLEVASENYGRIKEAEQLLVDFAGFVDRLVWLLEQCCHKETPETYNHASESSSGQDEHEPQFRAVLCVGSPGCGTLRLVQANAFKELAHLTLQLRAGSDASIKQFLSFRLHEVQAELTGARTKLIEVERSRASLAQELQTCRKTSDAAAAKHEVVQKQKEDEIKALKEHVCTLEQRIGDMTQQAQRAAAALTEAEKRTTAAETAAQCAQHAKSGADVELAECLSRVAAAEARCQAAEGRAGAAAERCQGFEAALKQAEARVEEWRGAATRQETRAIAVEEEAASLREKSRGTTRDHEVVSRRLEEVTNELAMAQKRVSDAQAEIQAGKQGRKDQESRIRELESALGE